MNIKPIQIDQNDDPRWPKFRLIETYNGGYDVSVMTPNGDTINVYIDKDGNTHVTLQGMDKVQPELWEY